MISHIPEWLVWHRFHRPYGENDEEVKFSQEGFAAKDPLVHAAETAFNNHERNTGEQVSPFDTGLVQIGVDGLEVRLLQGIDFESLQAAVARGVRATIGLPRPEDTNYSQERERARTEWEEMFRGGLQTALESQTIIFEVWGASRVLTHQLVRTRKAGFHQQSQRATWYGDRPEARMPETVWRASLAVRETWLDAYHYAWAAYQEACDAGVPYEDARYILPEGTVNYIQCEYTIREFINVFAYRGCSMFLREMVVCMRMMRDALIASSPWIEPYIKISCEKGTDCERCEGTGSIPDPDHYHTEECPDCKGIGSNRKCTFQGWENVERACDFQWAKESNRIYLPSPRLRIGAS